MSTKRSWTTLKEYEDLLFEFYDGISIEILCFTVHLHIINELLRAGNQDRPPEISYAWCANNCSTCLEQTAFFESNPTFASIAEFDENILLEAAIVNIQVR